MNTCNIADMAINMLACIGPSHNNYSGSIVHTCHCYMYMYMCSVLLYYNIVRQIASGDVDKFPDKVHQLDMGQCDWSKCYNHITIGDHAPCLLVLYKRMCMCTMVCACVLWYLIYSDLVECGCSSTSWLFRVCVCVGASQISLLSTELAGNSLPLDKTCSFYAAVHLARVCFA